MKKQAYITPEIHVITIATAQMLAASFTDKTTGVQFHINGEIEDEEDFG